jgi:hypothetical protein
VVSHNLVFLGGLHRSGTTALASWIADHPAVSALHDTGVPRDEGMFLQDVYPPSFEYGGPGRFALDPDAHLTESSPLVSAESRKRLWTAWSPFWNLDKPVLLEKSPPNLIRTRFLQAMFPGARFIIIVRHPIAVAYATKVWSRTSLRSLLRHWIRAHEHFLADAPFLDHVALVRYEDLVADLPREIAKLEVFLGLEPSEGSWEVRPELNATHYRRWGQQARRSRMPGLPRLFAKRAYIDFLAHSFESSVRPFGYSLRDPWELARVRSPVGRYLVSGDSRSRRAPVQKYPPGRLVRSYGDV